MTPLSPFLPEFNKLPPNLLLQIKCSAWSHSTNLYCWSHLSGGIPAPGIPEATETWGGTTQLSLPPFLIHWESRGRETAGQELPTSPEAEEQGFSRAGWLLADAGLTSKAWPGLESVTALWKPFEAGQTSGQGQARELLRLAWEGRFPVCFSQDGSAVTIILYDSHFRHQNWKKQ